MKRGTLLITIDVELLWGHHDRDWEKFVPVVRQSRSIIKELLDLFERYEISTTWAIVGHLFLDACRPVRGVKHPEITRPRFPELMTSQFRESLIRKDWFASDPVSSMKENSGWYGRDIVRLIKKYPRQEIACHSFSHLIFGDPGCSRVCTESDVKACVALAKKEDVRLSSFVFPRNRVGHLDILRKYGFTAYRGPEPPKPVQLYHFLSPFPPPVSDPIDRGGIFEIPPSMYLIPSARIGRWIPDGVILKKAIMGIDRAIDERKIFHLWFHPEDMYEKRKLSLLQAITAYALKHRSRRELTFRCMRDIARLHRK